MSMVNLESVLTCPRCGYAKQETMPTDACQFYYECSACHTLLRPKPGDCCVFCSFGSVPCPPIQSNVGAVQVEEAIGAASSLAVNTASNFCRTCASNCSACFDFDERQQPGLCIS